MSTCACTGACCAVFSLSKEAQALIAGGEGPEAAYIRGMLVPLGEEEQIERQVRFGTFAFRPATPDDPFVAKPGEGNSFTCRHFDEETKRCKAYARRPDMCRGFPYSRECRHCGLKLQEPGEEAA